MPASAPPAPPVALAGQELLDAQRVVARALHDAQQGRRLAGGGGAICSLMNHCMKLLAREVAALACHAHEIGALVGSALLLLERQRDRLGDPAERRLRRVHARDHDRLLYSFIVLLTAGVMTTSDSGAPL